MSIPCRVLKSWAGAGPHKLQGEWEAAIAKAEIHFLPGEFRVLKSGTYVLCAVSGRQIPLSELKYWNAERQEAYATAEISFARFEETRKSSGQPVD